MFTRLFPSPFPSLHKLQVGSDILLFDAKIATMAYGLIFIPHGQTWPFGRKERIVLPFKGPPDKPTKPDPPIRERKYITST
jgi:hypothetical protein